MHKADEKSRMFELAKTKRELSKIKKPASKVVRHCEGGTTEAIRLIINE